MYLVVKDKDGDLSLILDSLKSSEPYRRYVTVKKIDVETLLAAELIYALETEMIYTPQEVMDDLRKYFGNKINERESY